MQYEVKFDVKGIKMVLNSDRNEEEFRHWVIESLNTCRLRCTHDDTKLLSQDTSEVTISSIRQLDEDEHIESEKPIRIGDIILRLMQARRDKTSVRVSDVLELIHFICKQLYDRKLYNKYVVPECLTYSRLERFCDRSDVFLFDSDFDMIYLKLEYHSDVPESHLDDTIAFIIDDFIDNRENLLVFS